MYITQEKNLDGLDSTFTQLKDCHVEELNLFWEASEADLEVQESVGERDTLVKELSENGGVALGESLPSLKIQVFTQRLVRDLVEDILCLMLCTVVNTYLKGD